jgi:O-antigen/teichoic acid export membrane protein
VGTAGIILSFQIIRFLYGVEYLGAQRVLQIIFAASIFSSLSNPASAVLYGFDKQAFIYKYGAVLAIVNILLDFFMIRSFGAVGAAICYGIITILASVGGLIYTCKTMKLDYPVVSVFKILFSTVMMAIVMKLVIMHNGGIPGLIISALSGTSVYLICSLLLGNFEIEDFRILEHARSVFPGHTKTAVDYLYSFVCKFKKSVL